ncbi:MAG: Holliday junction branch migration protein RuvA [Nitrospirales bacterium]
MIAALTGQLVFKAPSHVTLDCHGVGYEVHIPLSTFYALPELNTRTSLNIHTHLREDAIQLFGFLTRSEKEAFLLLTGVSGIGPKLALSVLSALSVADLISAVRHGDVEKLASVPGIGKKSAGRLALELKDKVERLAPGLSPTPAPEAASDRQLEHDAQSALVNLGYRPADVKEILTRIVRSASGPLTLEALIRRALTNLAKG